MATSKARSKKIQDTALAALNPEVAEDLHITIPVTEKIERVEIIEAPKGAVVSPREMLPRRVVLGVVVLGMIIAPLFNYGKIQPSVMYWIQIGLIYVTIGLSVNILMGYLGQISLGHQGFVGIGAFMSAFMVSDRHLSFFLALVIAGATGALSALLLGFVALRLKGLFFAVVTLAYGFVSVLTIFQIPSFTGGGAGASAPRPPGFVSDRSYVYLCMIVVALLLWVDWRFVKSKAGRATFAIRENEVMAASFGINVKGYKLLAFAVAGTFAGLGGSLFAHQQTFINGGSFDFQLALTLVLMVVVGGLGSRVGVFIGSAFFAIFKPMLTYYWKGSGFWPDLIGAVLLLLTLTQFPGGIAQQIKPLTDWFGGKPLRGHGHTTKIAEGGAGVRP
ncbi:MAG: branched-chain amino acid ABC transporter permease [Actinomycetota bacterium]